nr:DBF4-type zinc finger-containing protein 2 homolog [Penaeus vannamei]
MTLWVKLWILLETPLVRLCLPIRTTPNATVGRPMSSSSGRSLVQLPKRKRDGGVFIRRMKAPALTGPKKLLTAPAYCTPACPGPLSCLPQPALTPPVPCPGPLSCLALSPCPTLALQAPALLHCLLSAPALPVLPLPYPARACTALLSPCPTACPPALSQPTLPPALPATLPLSPCPQPLPTLPLCLALSPCPTLPRAPALPCPQPLPYPAPGPCPALPSAPALPCPGPLHCLALSPCPTLPRAPALPYPESLPCLALPCPETLSCLNPLPLSLLCSPLLARFTITKHPTDFRYQHLR